MYDYIVDARGDGTHLTLNAAIEEAITAGRKATIRCAGSEDNVVERAIFLPEDCAEILITSAD